MKMATAFLAALFAIDNETALTAAMNETVVSVCQNP